MADFEQLEEEWSVMSLAGDVAAVVVPTVVGVAGAWWGDAERFEDRRTVRRTDAETRPDDDWIR